MGLGAAGPTGLLLVLEFYQRSPRLPFVVVGQLHGRTVGRWDGLAVGQSDSEPVGRPAGRPVGWSDVRIELYARGGRTVTWPDGGTV